MERTRGKYEQEISALEKKFRKQLVITLLSAVITVGVVSSMSLAWFANSRKVDSNNMKIQVESSSNLVITAGDTDFTNDQFSVSLAQPADHPLLYPARHIEGGVTIENTNAVNLYYNTNPQFVSMEKGLLEEELQEDVTALTFAYVPESKDNLSPYYIDYTIYLAASGRDITAESLAAQMELIYEDDELVEPDYWMAASVDFYFGSDKTYVGTLNAAGKNRTNSGETVDSVDLLPGEITQKFDIFDNSAKNGIPVLMRCYFDGGLLKQEGMTYVRTEGLQQQDFTIKVTFTAEDAAS